MAVAIASAAVAAGIGIAKLIKGAKDAKKAKAEKEALKMPFYKVQDEYYRNQRLAEGQAMGGLPQASKDYYTSETQRGLSASLGALLQAGGDPNMVGKLFDTYSRSVENIAAQDAQMHVDNIGRLMVANKDIAGQKNTKWAVDEKQPYENKLKEITERRAAAEQTMWNGVDTIGSGISSFATSQLNANLGKNGAKSSGGTNSNFSFDNVSPTTVNAPDYARVSAPSPADNTGGIPMQNTMKSSGDLYVPPASKPWWMQ